MTKEARALGVPRYQTLHAAGMDLRTVEKGVLRPGERMLFRTGISIAIPPGMEGQIRSRSGLALKQGLVVLNSPGTIDADYRGGIAVLLYNAGNEVQSVEIGERIAQIVFARVENVVLQPVETIEELGKTARGAGGYGSTGVT